MASTHINFRTWLALLLLGALTVLFATLGNWQLDRAAQRDAIFSEIRQAASIPPVTLAVDTPDSELLPWRHARAQGNWLHRYTVLIQNRNDQGRPGYWVATPLQLTSDSHAPAILVLRGWLPRETVVEQTAGNAARPDPELGRILAQQKDTHHVSGQLFPHVPRLLELWTWSDSDQARLPATLVDTRDELPAVQNLDLDDYRRATGLALLPVVLAAESPEPPYVPAMTQNWPHPSSDSDTNRGYALQWFSFCAIAAGAWLFIAWRAVRKYLSGKSV